MLSLTPVFEPNCILSSEESDPTRMNDLANEKTPRDPKEILGYITGGQ